MILGIADLIIDGTAPPQWVESIALIVGAAVLYWYVSRRSFAERPARWIVAAAVPLAVLAIGLIDIYPTIATKRSLATQIADYRQQAGHEQTPIVCFGRYEDSLIFYNRDTKVLLFNTDHIVQLSDYLRDNPRVLVVTQEEYVPDLRNHLPPGVSLEVQAPSRGKIYVAARETATPQISSGLPSESRR